MLVYVSDPMPTKMPTSVHTVTITLSATYTFLDFYQDIQNTANEKARFLVRTSYLEIYNESISDLIVSVCAMDEYDRGANNISLLLHFPHV